jgi:protein phosphatase
MIGFKSFGFTDPGKIRRHNEDRYLVNDDQKLFLIADGMGGHASGETASQMAVGCIASFIDRSRAGESYRPLEYRQGLTQEQNRFLTAVTYANQEIKEAAEKNPEMDGMGTTIVGAIIEDDDHLAVVNVGDSRLYRIRDKEIKQITQDHTLVGEQERKGILTRAEARNHPQKHILTNALGTRENPLIDLYRVKIEPSDLYLICSDGLHDMLDEQEILKTITSIHDQSLYKIGLSLVLGANLVGGPDNITVILLHFEPDKKEPE